MSERNLIAVIGDAALREDSEKYILAENLGRSLIDHGRSWRNNGSRFKRGEKFCQIQKG